MLFYKKPFSYNVLALFFVFGALSAAAAPYNDTKDRFEIDLASGWRLAPVPLDGTGMVFKKDVDLSPGLLRVHVAPWEPGLSVRSQFQKLMEPFEAEIGFHEISRRVQNKGGWLRHHINFTMFANGDARVVRKAQLEMIVAYGSAYVIYFECLEKGWKYFSADLRLMQKSFKPKINRDTYAAVVGEWADVENGQSFILRKNNEFEMSHLKGIYTVDGGQMLLYLRDGQERFRYRLQQKKLYLSNSNLTRPQTFKRIDLLRTKSTGSKKKEQKPKSVKRMDLYGKWRVVDGSLAEPLTLFLSPTGTMAFGPMHGRWKYDNFTLTLTSVSGTQRVYHLSLDGRRMRMSGGDLDNEIILVRAK